MPTNPLLANPVYLAGYIEQIGTGTTDLIDRCVADGLPRPTFTLEDDFLLTIYRLTPQDTPQDNLLKNSYLDSATPQDTPQDTPQVTPQVIRVYRAVGDRALTKQQIMTILGLEDREHFRLTYLQPALAAGLLEMTIPDKPTSKNQKYRATKKGKELNL